MATSAALFGPLRGATPYSSWERLYPVSDEHEQRGAGNTPLNDGRASRWAMAFPNKADQERP